MSLEFFSLGDTTPENNWTRGGYFVEVFLEGLFFLAGLRLVFVFETFLAVCCNSFVVRRSALTGPSRGLST